MIAAIHNATKTECTKYPEHTPSVAIMPAFAPLPITCDKIKSISGPGVKIRGITVNAKSKYTDISVSFQPHENEKIVSAKIYKIGFQNIL